MGRHLSDGGWRSNMAAILLGTTPVSQRAEPSPLWCGTFPKRRTRRGTTRISRVRCGKAKRSCASRVPLPPGAKARRTRGVLVVRAPPPFSALVRHGGRQRWRPRWRPFAPLRGGRSLHSDPWREGHRAGQEAGAEHSGAGSGEETDHSSPTGHDRYLEDRGLYPRCPTRGTSRLLAGRGFRADPIRSDTTIDASIHGQEGPPKSDSKRWV